MRQVRVIDGGYPQRYTQLSYAAAIVRLAPLLIVLALILFPLGWLGERWYPFGQLIGRVFPTAREHAFGHGSLFLLLGILTLVAFPPLSRRPQWYIGPLFLVAIGQEAFQFLYKQRLLVFDDVRDLATDLVGLIAAFAVVWAWGWVRRRRGRG